MDNRVYNALATILAAKEDIDIETAMELVDETIYQIRDYEEGESYYNSREEIISDFLDLGSSYAMLFV